jgi:monofunctional biosynthetic peptidoglycan transglycosylase
MTVNPAMPNPVLNTPNVLNIPNTPNPAAPPPPSKQRRLFKLALKLTLKLMKWGVIAVLLLQVWFALHIVWWKWLPVNETSFMRADLAAMQAKNPKAKAVILHTWVAYEDISDHIKRAVISSEDADFEYHDGVDWDAIEQARETNAKRGKVVAGGSTITMQLAKNLFLSGSRSYVRKAQELAITYMLEALLSKERILEMYLNSAEFGIGVYGVQAGAQHHFGISAKALSPEQAARMAAMLPRPKFYDKNRGSAYLQKRTRIISARMRDVDVPE